MNRSRTSFAAIAAAPAVLAGAVVVCLSSCDRQPRSAGDGDVGVVVARVGGDDICLDEVDARILALPPSARPKPGDDLDAWFESQVREAAVDHLLAASADDRHLADDPGFVTATREAERQVTIELCLQQLHPEPDEITDADVQAEYDRLADSLAAPERRAAYHLFRRFVDGAPRDQTRREIEGLRDRVLRGESFTRLAASMSDSESRHREGSIGRVVPGQLSPEVERVLFALDEGVPSDPVATPEGYHLFYVDQILPTRRLTLDEARPMLVERLADERREAILAEIEGRTAPPPDSLILDQDQLQEVAEAGDPEAPVLRIDDTTVTLGDLMRRSRQALANHNPSRQRPPMGLGPWQMLESLRRRALIYGYCRDDVELPAAELEAKLTEWRERALVQIERRRRLLELAKADDDRLRTYYESNIGQFSSQPTWHLRRLRIPFSSHTNRIMARLETAAADRSGQLDSLQRELGGEVDDLGTVSAVGLSRKEPKLPALVAPLDVGQISDPYRTADALEIVEVVEHTGAAPLPFDSVRDKVAAAYLDLYSADLYAKLSDSVLSSAHFEIVPEGMAQLRAGLPGPEDVSVEDLEALLNQLE